MTKEKLNDGETVPVKAKLFDLAALDTVKGSNDGAVIEIVHPATKELIGINITVVGKHGERFREIVKERSDNRTRQESFQSRRNKPVVPRNLDQLEKEAIALLAGCTLSWESGELTEEGELINTKPVIVLEDTEYEFNIPNAIMIYTRMIWMREQVDNAIGTIENFIQA